jgi:lambda family phage minor tail protein L
MSAPQSDIQKLDPGTKVELYELDTTDLGGQIEYFHDGTTAGRTEVIWQGNAYRAWPIHVEGFEINGNGQQPTPKIRAGNIGGAMTVRCIAFADMVGARLTRRRVFAKYLDGMPGADPTAGFPEDVFFIERKTYEGKIYVEWELSSSLDVEDVYLPLRQVIANACPWDYRSAECSYVGPPVAKLDDSPTNDPTLDRCGKRLGSCKIRFGPFGPLPFGGFPGASKQ